jgi:hypothetical protein
MSPTDTLTVLIAATVLALWATVHYTNRWLHR